MMDSKLLRKATGIRYASVWFVSMAVYYLVLGSLRAYLIICCRRRTPELERHHGRLRLRHRYSDCYFYAAPRQEFEKEGGIS